MNTVIETQFFGPIAAFASLPYSGQLVVERHDRWQKMSYRNRTQVLGQTTVLNLSVPVVGGRDQRVLMNEVAIDYTGRWKKEHWRTLESLYNRSPYFDHYAPGLLPVWNQEPALLIDWNTALLEWTLRQLRWPGTVHASSEWQATYSVDTHADQRGRFLPKNRLTFQLPAYQQVFGQRFEPNLSILDLLFNTGPDAPSYLRQISHTLFGQLPSI